MKHLKAFITRIKVSSLNLYEHTRVLLGIDRKLRYKHKLMNRGYPIECIVQDNITFE